MLFVYISSHFYTLHIDTVSLQGQFNKNPMLIFSAWVRRTTVWSTGVVTGPATGDQRRSTPSAVVELATSPLVAGDGGAGIDCAAWRERL